MDTTQGLNQIITEGRKLYQCILADAVDLLRGLDTTSPAAMMDTVQRRQDNMELLQNINGRLDRMPSVEGTIFAEFRAFQEEVTKKIMATDGLVIALIREKQSALMGKRASLTKSATVFQAYGKRGRGQPPWVNDLM